MINQPIHLLFPTQNVLFFDNVRVVPGENDATPQSVPENSLTTALLVIAGLIFLNPHKLF